MNIAVIGAGVSGLVAAHLLHPDHEVTVFEAGAYAGGHANTVTVGEHEVDTGFIGFNDRNYPRFKTLVPGLRVWTPPPPLYLGVSDGKDFEYASTSPNGLYARRAHLLSPRFQRMLADVPRFQRHARELLESGAAPPLREWLGGGRAAAARVAGVAGALGGLRGARDRPAGRRGVVRGPRADVELPGALPRRVLRQPRDAGAARPPAMADRDRWLAPLRAGAHRAVR